MNRSLLTPRWLALHALFLVAVAATGLLAVWQWERAHDAGGSFQNLGYALQWPLFGAFTIFLWYRMIRMTLVEHSGGSAPEPTKVSSESTGETTERRRRLVPLPARPVDADEDPELVAYNRYLAELNEVDQGR